MLRASAVGPRRRQERLSTSGKSTGSGGEGGGGDDIWRSVVQSDAALTLSGADPAAVSFLIRLDVGVTNKNAREDGTTGVKPPRNLTRPI